MSRLYDVDDRMGMVIVMRFVLNIVPTIESTLLLLLLYSDSDS